MSDKVTTRGIGITSSTTQWPKTCSKWCQKRRNNTKAPFVPMCYQWFLLPWLDGNFILSSTCKAVQCCQDLVFKYLFDHFDVKLLNVSGPLKLTQIYSSCKASEAVNNCSGSELSHFLFFFLFLKAYSSTVKRNKLEFQQQLMFKLGYWVILTSASVEAVPENTLIIRLLTELEKPIK